MDLFGYVDNVLNFFRLPIWRYLIYGTIFILIVIWLAFVYWTFRDAKLRNTSLVAAIFWALVVLAFNFLGLVIYLILRPPEYIEDVLERDLEIKRMQLLLVSPVVMARYGEGRISKSPSALSTRLRWQSPRT